MAGVRKVAVASAVGNAVELYDFLLYGTASALVFDKLFFPQFDPRIGVLLSFATFGAGFLARPIGGVVIGHFGDRVGRRTMLVITLTATGLATALIGVLPTYQSAGILAPILLIVLRVLQGFFIGGEQGGASLMAVEHAPSGRTGWYGSWIFIGSPVGLVLANLAMVLADSASGPDFLSWGWRLPFLLSLVLVGIGLYVRLSVQESPVFNREESVKLPIAEVLRDDWRRVLLGAGVNFGFNMFIFVVATFAVSFSRKQLGLSQNTVLVATLVGACAQAISVPLFARLSDRIGRLPVMLGGAVFIGVFAFPFFWLLDGRYLMIAMVLAFVGSGALFGPMPAYYAELFQTRVRYSGVSLTYQLGAVLGGGLSPFIATWLINETGSTLSVAAYLVGGAIVSTICLLAIGSRRTIELEPAQERL
jgi:MHS family shikimate/dehydroshikimate transporter-like MFS transporter